MIVGMIIITNRLSGGQCQGVWWTGSTVSWMARSNLIYHRPIMLVPRAVDSGVNHRFVEPSGG